MTPLPSFDDIFGTDKDTARNEPVVSSSPEALQPDEYDLAAGEIPLDITQLPQMEDLMTAVQSIENQEEQLRSAKPHDSDNENDNHFPELPRENLSVVSDVKRHEDEVMSLKHSVISINTDLHMLKATHSRVDDHAKRFDSLDIIIAALQERQSSIDKRMIDIQKQITNSHTTLMATIAASERKILQSKESGSTPAIEIKGSVPPATIVTPGAPVPIELSAPPEISSKTKVSASFPADW